MANRAVWRQYLQGQVCRHAGRPAGRHRRCNAVVNSPYSRVFGVPMSYFGFIYFLYMFALATRLVFEPFAQSLRLRAILYAAMGAISSMYFIYLQLRFIRELCSYCLISAVVSVLLVFAALWHFQATRHRVAKS